MLRALCPDDPSPTLHGYIATMRIMSQWCDHHENVSPDRPSSSRGGHWVGQLVDVITDHRAMGFFPLSKLYAQPLLNVRPDLSHAAAQRHLAALDKHAFLTGNVTAARLVLERLRLTIELNGAMEASLSTEPPRQLRPRRLHA